MAAAQIAPDLFTDKPAGAVKRNGGNQRLTIEEMHEIARERGGECLSESYININIKLRWRCAQGHEWEAVPYSVKNGTWCKKCSDARSASARRDTIETMRTVALKRGGLCLSKTYIRANAKLRWRCAKGHEWEAEGSSVKNAGAWCRKCAAVKNGIAQRDTLEEMQEIARSRHGLCLSQAYKGANVKLRWRCSQGHEWETTPGVIKHQGSWCPECAHAKQGRAQRDTIEEMQWLAHRNGGACLSEAYTNQHTKLHWRCSAGHEWWARPHNIKNGGWCPKCSHAATAARNRARGRTIERMRELARERGGECLSQAYPGYNAKLRWRCADGHEWEAIPGSIRRGTWCPTCRWSIKEQACRSVLEQLFDAPFPKSRPQWLKTECGGMELDGYNERLALAFEYNGEQHYRKVSRYKSSDKTLRAQRERDLRKRLLCNKNGVALLEIPYWVDVKELSEWITKRLIALGKLPSNKTAPPRVTVRTAHANSRLTKLKEIARERGGECLSQVYLGSETKLHWRCSAGHEWWARPHNVKDKGGWCPKCVHDAQRLTLKEMQELAHQRGGECLSESYTDGKTKLRWRCSNGHEWEAVGHHVKGAGSWCPECAYAKSNRDRRLTIFEMQVIAWERGGACLSTSYTNLKTKLRWRCAAGHEWEAPPSNIKSGRTWCPKCAAVERGIAKRHTIEEMQQLAHKRGGQCLSTSYTGAHAKLRWRCAEGHEWETMPATLKNGGAWCPVCGRAKMSLKKRRPRPEAPRLPPTFTLAPPPAPPLRAAPPGTRCAPARA